jgi:hypothetical protein
MHDQEGTPPCHSHKRLSSRREKGKEDKKRPRSKSKSADARVSTQTLKQTLPLRTVPNFNRTHPFAERESQRASCWIMRRESENAGNVSRRQQDQRGTWNCASTFLFHRHDSTRRKSRDHERNDDRGRTCVDPPLQAWQVTLLLLALRRWLAADEVDRRRPNSGSPRHSLS